MFIRYTAASFHYGRGPRCRCLRSIPIRRIASLPSPEGRVRASAPATLRRPRATSHGRQSRRATHDLRRASAAPPSRVTASAGFRCVSAMRIAGQTTETRMKLSSNSAAWPGCCIARSFIVSMSSSLAFVWGQRQHTSTCERGVPSVGARTRELPPARRWSRFSQQHPERVYGGKAARIEPPSVTGLASARQLFEPRLLCTVVRRDPFGHKSDAIHTRAQHYVNLR